MFFNNWFDWFFNNGSKGFSAKLRFCIFGSCISFFNKLVDEKNGFGFYDEL